MASLMGSASSAITIIGAKVTRPWSLVEPSYASQSAKRHEMSAVSVAPHCYGAAAHVRPAHEWSLPGEAGLLV